jgi:hypothetical protein
MFYNGDWRKNTIETYVEVDSLELDAAGELTSSSRLVVCSNLYSAGVTIGLFGGSASTKMPSLRDWGSCSKALASHTLFFRVHQAGPRSIANAFPGRGSQVAVSAKPHEDDYHKMVKSKITRSCLYTSNSILQDYSALTCAISEFLDHLQMRVQHESEAGHFLFSLLHDRSNPFVETQMALGRLVKEPPNNTTLEVVFHFCNGEEAARELAIEARAIIFELSGCLFAVCEMFFDRDPFKLLTLVDAQASPLEKTDCAERVLGKPRCCNEEAFIGKIVDVHKTAQSEMGDRKLLGALTLFVVKGLVGNIGL